MNSNNISIKNLSTNDDIRQKDNVNIHRKIERLGEVCYGSVVCAVGLFD